MSTLTKAQAKLLADLGLTSSDVEKAQAKQARETKRDAMAAVLSGYHGALAEILAAVTEVSPIAPSTSEGSSWVGVAVATEVNGIGVKIVFTDKAASDARKAASKNA